MGDLKFVTIREAADRLKCSPNKIRELILEKRIRAVDLRKSEIVRHTWRIPEDAIDELVKN
jgi:excisionase family DNA binding protein